MKPSCTCTIFRAAHRGEMEANDVPPRMNKRIAQMILHRDFAGEYDWIAVDCDKKGAPRSGLCKTGVDEHT